METVRREVTRFQLYVAGKSQRSAHAISNVRSICDQKYKGCHELEIIDIYLHPDLAEQENIFEAPTLVRSQPLPKRRIVGDMTCIDRVMSILGV
jgi:circadian clock protein KaiB